MQGNVATPSAPPGSAAAAPRKRRFFDMNNTRTFAGMLITPAQLVLLLIIIFPLGLEAYISMTSWTPDEGRQLVGGLAVLGSGLRTTSTC